MRYMIFVSILCILYSCKKEEKVSQPQEVIESKKPEQEMKKPVEPAKAKEETAEEKPTDLPEGAVDRDKLAQCYEEIYCAQKAMEFDKIIDIYKKYGFDKPEKFSKLWIKMAQDKEWMEKVIKEIPKKCPEPPQEKKEEKSKK